VTVGSLFAGIGGFDLAAERVGWKIRWQVEIDPFCRQVLAKHWPEVRRYDDVRTVTGLADSTESGWGTRRSRGSPSEDSRLSDEAQRHVRERLEPVDLVCGGFPCQPHSLAGRRGGAADERDLWPQFARLIRELEPRWVVAENVPGLLSNDAGRFFGAVLRDLAACGYDAEWDCIPASAVGAPHRRDRVWLVAYPIQSRLERYTGDGAGRLRQAREVSESDRSTRETGLRRGTWTVADADSGYGHGRDRHVQMGRIWGARQAALYDDIAGTQWRTEPDVGRVAYGVPARVDRLRGLGNAIVPQVAEWIFRRIDAWERVTA
jgi:DNA (cytosine-5)-methyltransferase 1